jgi:TetR/AcrR family transcriptional regulator, regulator of mycofactocin system
MTVDHAAPTRRERKKLATRQALEEAALRLFAAQGYEQTTVEEIAEAADVAVRTFFRYFSSKQDVLFGEVASDRLGRLHTELAARPLTEAPLDSVIAAMEKLDLVGTDEEQQILARLDLMRHQPTLRIRYLELINSMRQAIVEFVADRSDSDARRDMYALLVAAAAAASWETSLSLWAESGGALSLRELRRQAFAALSAGLPERP